MNSTQTVGLLALRLSGSLPSETCSAHVGRGRIAASSAWTQGPDPLPGTDMSVMCNPGRNCASNEPLQPTCKVARADPAIRDSFALGHSHLPTGALLRERLGRDTQATDWQRPKAVVRIIFAHGRAPVVRQLRAGPEELPLIGSALVVGHVGWRDHDRCSAFARAALP
eukprot:14570173-Alexandrium_andersonii.AAC.1